MQNKHKSDERKPNDTYQIFIGGCHPETKSGKGITLKKKQRT